MSKEFEHNPQPGDYIGYLYFIEGNENIVLEGPLTRKEAIIKAQLITNYEHQPVVRTFAKNQGQAMLNVLEAFIRRDQLMKKKEG